MRICTGHKFYALTMPTNGLYHTRYKLMPTQNPMPPGSSSSSGMPLLTKSLANNILLLSWWIFLTNGENLTPLSSSNHLCLLHTQLSCFSHLLLYHIDPLLHWPTLDNEMHAYYFDSNSLNRDFKTTLNKQNHMYKNIGWQMKCASSRKCSHMKQMWRIYSTKRKLQNHKFKYTTTKHIQNINNVHYFCACEPSDMCSHARYKFNNKLSKLHKLQSAKTQIVQA